MKVKVKKNKDCIVQMRCTEEEKKKLKQLSADSKMSCSDFMRHKVFDQCPSDKKQIIFTVAAQEFLNCVEDICGINSVLEEKADILWNLLNS